MKFGEIKCAWIFLNENLKLLELNVKHIPRMGIYLGQQNFLIQIFLSDDFTFLKKKELK